MIDDTLLIRIFASDRVKTNTECTGSIFVVRLVVGVFTAAVLLTAVALTRLDMEVFSCRLGSCRGGWTLERYLCSCAFVHRFREEISIETDRRATIDASLRVCASYRGLAETECTRCISVDRTANEVASAAVWMVAVALNHRLRTEVSGFALACARLSAGSISGALGGCLVPLVRAS